MSLIDKLVETQRAMHLTDERFAAELRVSRSYWSMLRSGDRRPGRKFIGAITRRFPHMAADALLDARDDPSFLVPLTVTDSDVPCVTTEVTA